MQGRPPTQRRSGVAPGAERATWPREVSLGCESRLLSPSSSFHHRLNSVQRPLPTLTHPGLPRCPRCLPPRGSFVPTSVPMYSCLLSGAAHPRQAGRLADTHRDRQNAGETVPWRLGGWWDSIPWEASGRSSCGGVGGGDSPLHPQGLFPPGSLLQPLMAARGRPALHLLCLRGQAARALGRLERCLQRLPH